MPKQLKKNNLAFIILAHNEEIAIEGTVKHTMAMLSSNDKLFVVADNCTDNTAEIARNAGANVIKRDNGSAEGKGIALAWFVNKYRDDIKDFSFIVLLDADSVIKHDFVHTVKSIKHAENNAYQCFVYPLFWDEDKFPIGKLAGLSELIDQLFADKIRTRLRWPVRLRGTGMIISPEILMGVHHLLATNVEDIALTLILTAKGVSIDRIDQAIVYDPKPRTSVVAVHQRARWFRGQWNAMWRYRGEILHILINGPAGWSLLSSIFLRPKWLILAISLLSAMWLSSFSWLSLIFWSYFFLGVSYLFIGFLLIPENREYIRALVYTPAYFVMWIQSISLSLRSSTWFRARK